MSLVLAVLMTAAGQVPTHTPAPAPGVGPGERETANGLSYARPGGWTRKQLADGSVGLSPPGPDGETSALVILPGEASRLAPAAGHARALATVTRGGRVDGPVARATVAGWARSEVKLVSAQGQAVWTALYTRAADGRLNAVVFVAATSRVFEAYRAAVERLIASVDAPAPGAAAAPATTAPLVAETPAAAAAPGTRIHGLLIPYPPTWARRDDPSGAVTLIPPQMQGVQQYFLSVLPPSPMRGTHWESHRALVASVLAQVQWTAEPVTRDYVDAPGPFIWTSIAGQVASGGLQSLELYSAAHDGTLEAVLGVNRLDRNVTDPVLAQVAFASPPRAADRPRIVEAFRRLNQTLYPDRAGGGLVAGSLVYQRIWLRSDGVADFTTTYPEGYAASRAVLKADPALLDGDHGRWTAVGDEIHIVRRAGSAPERYRRERGGLTGGGGHWQSMPRVDDLRLAGRWSIRSAPGETVSAYYDWIEFTADGRFASEGVLKRISFGQAGRPKPPDPARGTYRIRDWTIVFTFADGRTWSTDFSTLGEETPGSGAILFGGDVYPRER